MTRRVLDRDALIGSVIAGGFGVAWVFWAAAGLSGTAASVVRISGVVIGAVVMVIAGALLVRGGADSAESSPDLGAGSMFRSREYLVSLATELVTLFVGNAVLNATGNSEYVPSWTAFVVGVHFIGFGRLFEALFYWLGGAFVIAAGVGAAVGAAAGTTQAVEASTGFIAAVSLFVAGAVGLLAPPRGPAAAGELA